MKTPEQKLSYLSREMRYRRSMCAVHTPGSDEHNYHSRKLREVLDQLKQMQVVV